MATITLKTMMQGVENILGKQFAGDSIYRAINSAIDDLNSAGGLDSIMPETKVDIAIDTNDEFAFSNLTLDHRRTMRVRNEKVQDCISKRVESINNIASAGDLVYAQEENKLFVKPAVTTLTGETLTFVADGDTISSSTDFSAAGFEAGQKIIVSGADEDDNNGTFTISSLVDDTTIAVEEALADEGPTGSCTLGLAYQLIYRSALPQYSAYTSTLEITINSYFKPAIIHSAIASLSAIKGLPLAEKYMALYIEDLKNLTVMSNTRKEIDI